jgi:hypothetical protein
MMKTDGGIRLIYLKPKTILGWGYEARLIRNSRIYARRGYKRQSFNLFPNVLTTILNQMLI